MASDSIQKYRKICGIFRRRRRGFSKDPERIVTAISELINIDKRTVVSALFFYTYDWTSKGPGDREACVWCLNWVKQYLKEGASRLPQEKVTEEYKRVIAKDFGISYIVAGSLVWDVIEHCFSAFRVGETDTHSVLSTEFMTLKTPKVDTVSLGGAEYRTRLLEAFIKHYGKEVKRVLYPGCGYDTRPYVLWNAEGRHIVYFDVSKDSIQWLKDNVKGDGFSVVRGKMRERRCGHFARGPRDMPFKESFDLVYLRGLKIWDELVDECAHVLRPGGLLLIDEVSTNDVPDILKHFRRITAPSCFRELMAEWREYERTTGEALFKVMRRSDHHRKRWTNIPLNTPWNKPRTISMFLARRKARLVS